MTKKEIQYIHYIFREIKWVKKRLEYINKKRQCSKNDGWYYMSAVLECEITELLNMTVERRGEIVAFISGMDDSLTRHVIYLRDISLLTWNQTADYLNCTVSKAKRRYYRFIKNLDSI